jgi:hypothetical protein
MADITLTAGMIARPYKSPWGAFPMKSMPISSGISSNAIQLGRVVSLDFTDSNAGFVLPSSQTAGVVMSTAIVGISADTPTAAGTVGGLSNVKGTVISIWEANPLVDFRAQTQGANLASSAVGKNKALVWDSTLAIHKVDLSNSTIVNVRVRITGLIDAEGDSGGAVSFKFLTRTPTDSTAYLLAFFD